MKSPFAAAAIGTMFLMAACSQPISPSRPSPASSAGLSPASPSESSKAMQSVPFKGRLEGTQVVTPLQPPMASVTGSASGTATHLGQFTVVFPHTVNFATRTGEGTYTFTAANGDTLVASFTGRSTLNGTTVSLEEHGTITGGTGRFATATGSFITHRTFDQVSRVTTGSFDGEISF